ncbi:hypothetical protein ACVGW6_03885, partial [Enterobacter intestinihominis]
MPGKAYRHPAIFLSAAPGLLAKHTPTLLLIQTKHPMLINKNLFPRFSGFVFYKKKPPPHNLGV